MEPARILIVEDQPAFAKGLRALLLAEVEPDSQVIEVVGKGSEAIEICETFLPHLILMDIRLPDQSGIETTAQIKQTFPSTVVVMLTSSDEEEDLFGALKAGASGYLLKTLDLHEIATAVESILHGNLVIPAHLAPAIHKLLGGPDTQGIKLTTLEEAILTLVGRGENNERIAGALSVSTEDVAKQVGNIYTKLHITTRAEAVAEAVRRGLA